MEFQAPRRAAPITVSVIEGSESPAQGWVSTRFYERRAAPVLCVRTNLSPGEVFRTNIGALDG
jgi:hypothetical protein